MDMRFFCCDKRVWLSADVDGQAVSQKAREKGSGETFFSHWSVRRRNRRVVRHERLASQNAASNVYRRYPVFGGGQFDRHFVDDMDLEYERSRITPL